MRIRPLAAADLDAVRQLRNQNREAFFDDREITADRHAQWFASLSSRPVQFFVIEEDDMVVGTISLTDTGRGREIGNLLLDERYRGRGFMTKAVRELTKEPGVYFAEVKPGNRDSLAVFERAGFDPCAIRVCRRADA